LSAARSGRSDVGDEGLGSIDAESWPRPKATCPPPSEEISDAVGSGKHLVGSAGPERVGPNHHGNRLAVASDGHLVASKDPVEDVGQCGSSLAGGHRPGHD